MARPSTVPTAAPASAPPFMAEAITSSSASTRPIETVSRTIRRESVISSVESRSITATPCRSPPSSPSPASASRKKKAPPKARTVSRNIADSSPTRSRARLTPPSHAVTAMTEAAAAGMKKGVR